SLGRGYYLGDVRTCDVPGRCARLLRTFLGGNHAQCCLSAISRPERISGEAGCAHSGTGNPDLHQISVADRRNSAHSAEPAIWKIPHQSIQDLAGSGCGQHYFLRQLCAAEGDETTWRRCNGGHPRRSVFLDRNYCCDGATIGTGKTLQLILGKHFDCFWNDVSAAGCAAGDFQSAIDGAVDSSLPGAGHAGDWDWLVVDSPQRS